MSHSAPFLLAVGILAGATQAVLAAPNSGALNPFLNVTLRGGGWTAANGSLTGRDGSIESQTTLALDPLPGGAVVKYAYLYWDTTGGTDDTATLNGTAVTGTQIGTSNGCGTNHASTVFRADVKALINSSATAYVVAGLPSSNGTSGPDTNGASLLIIWENLAAADETTFVVRDGSETTSSGAGVVFEAGGFVVPPGIVKADYVTFADARVLEIYINDNELHANLDSARSTNGARSLRNVYDANPAVLPPLDAGETSFKALSSLGSTCFVQTLGMLAMNHPICNGTATPSGATIGAPPGDGVLKGFLTETIRGGGVVSAGAGFAGRSDSGADMPVSQQTLAIAGIPAGAAVRHAYLYWDTYGGTDASVTVNGTAVQGVAIGKSGPTCWNGAGALAAGDNNAFRADVTALVSGNGNYVVAGLLSSSGGGQGNRKPDAQGASLVVLFADPTADQDTTVAIIEGAYSLSSPGQIEPTIDLPTVPIEPTQANLLLLVGDGQSALPDGQLRVNGEVVQPLHGGGHFPGFEGRYWDNYNIDITDYVHAGDTELVWKNLQNIDCLVFVAAVASYTVPAENGAGPECGGATTTTGVGTTSTSTSTIAGSTTTTIFGQTTTTTLPPGAEACGNCRDDDGDGLTDLEDPDCCAGGALTLAKARLKPSKKVPGTTIARLKMTFADPGAVTLDPTKQDTVVQLHRRGGTPDYCARIPAAAVIGKKGKTYKFVDKTGGVASAAGVKKIVIKRKKGGVLLATLAAKAAKFATPAPGPIAITLGFAGADGTNQCVGVQPQLAPQGKKGALRAP